MNSVIQELLSSGAQSLGVGGLTAMQSVFNRENIVRALLPKTLAGGVNHLFDRFGGGTVTPETRGAGNVRPMADEEGEDTDDFDALFESIEEGLEEANETLTKILVRLGGDTADVALTELVEEGQVQLLHELSEEDDSMVDLIAINGQILNRLDQIERNTRIDELKAREEEIEARRTNSHLIQTLSSSSTASRDTTATEKKEGFLSKVLEYLPEIGGGYLGMKTAGKALGMGGKKPATGIRGALGRLPFGRAAAAAATVAPAAIPSSLPSALGGVDDVVKAVAPKGGVLNGVKSIGGKLLGAPLAIGMGAYEAYETHANTELTTAQKTTEYSKIGGKTAGALAGAKAGAVIGAIGGPIGSAIGGLLGGIGGFFLGEKGGEVVGNLINAVMPSDAPSTVDARSNELTLETIRNKTEDSIKQDFVHAANITERISPSALAVTAGQTRPSNLMVLTQQMDQVTHEKATMDHAPIIAPVNVNASTTNQGTMGQNNPVRIPIPTIRSQDGTIQRLLDANYKTLMG